MKEQAINAVGIIEFDEASEPLKNYIQNKIANEPNVIDEKYLSLIRTGIQSLGLIKEKSNLHYLTTILKEYNSRCKLSTGKEIGEAYSNNINISDKGYAKNICINTIKSLSYIGNRETIITVEKITKDLIEIEKKGITDGSEFIDVGYDYNIPQIQNIAKTSIKKMKERTILEENKYDTSNSLW